MQVTEQTLMQVGQNVLETMAFVFVMPGGEECISEPIVRAVVTYEGPFCGATVLAVPEEIVPELVTNMFGEEELEPAALQVAQYDAIGELANVMCGNIVQALAGPQPVFQLGSPKIVKSEQDSVPLPTGQTTTVRIPLETGCVELSLIVAVEAAKGADSKTPAGVAGT